MTPPAPPPDDFEGWLLARKRRQRRLLVGLVVLAVAGLGGWIGVRKALRDPTLRARILHPIASTTPAGIDWNDVCAHEVPDWWVAVANRMDPGGAEAADAALAALQARVSADPALGPLFAGMHDLATDDPAGQAERLLELSRTGSRHLETIGSSCWWTGAVMGGDAHAFFYLKTYRVQVDATAQVGASPQRIRLLSRLDHTNVVEGYLGSVMTDADGGLVVLDRVAEFAADVVWPMLDPEIDATLDPLSRTLAPAVRAEVEPRVGEEAWKILTGSASTRYRMVRAVDAVQSRRSCGSTYRILALPWNGFDSLEMASIRRAADRADSTCPGVTPSEADALGNGSQVIRSSRDVEAAFGTLLALVARPIAVHELRHAADPDPVPCPGCPEGPSEGVVSEASAYLASFAAPDLGALAVLQALHANEGEWNTHATALDLLLGGLFPDGPVDALPADFSARAAALEQAWFGRNEPITLPGDWPARLLP